MVYIRMGTTDPLTLRNAVIAIVGWGTAALCYWLFKWVKATPEDSDDSRVERLRSIWTGVRTVFEMGIILAVVQAVGDRFQSLVVISLGLLYLKIGKAAEFIPSLTMPVLHGLYKEALFTKLQRITTVRTSRTAEETSRRIDSLRSQLEECRSNKRKVKRWFPGTVHTLRDLFEEETFNDKELGTC